MALSGIFGRPFLDLTHELDLEGLDAVHDEICLGLAQVPAKYTGGSHRSMHIVPTRRETDVYIDYGEVIAALSAAEYQTFRSLATVPSDYPATLNKDATFGEERAYPLSSAQMRWLEVRHGVYFPWKTFVELMPVERWEDKDHGEGRFTWEAETYFPKTLAFLRSLPLTHIGRASIMGLQSFDHGTVHRDGEHGDAPSEFLMFCPMENKELFLWDEETRTEHLVCAKAYWFNDCDYHGVRSAPHFRYSLRVDGPFTDSFRAQIRKRESLAEPR